MRVKEVQISNGTLEIPEKIKRFLNTENGDMVRFETNDDGSVTIRRKETITNLKGILKKGETPELHANGAYQFNGSSKTGS